MIHNSSKTTVMKQQHNNFMVGGKHSMRNSIKGSQHLGRLRTTAIGLFFFCFGIGLYTALLAPTHCLDPGDLKFIEFCLQSVGIKGMHHHLLFFFFKKEGLIPQSRKMLHLMLIKQLPSKLSDGGQQCVRLIRLTYALFDHFSVACCLFSVYYRCYIHRK